MDNFLVSIEYDSVTGAYMACYANGENILLGANTYADAVCEADMIDVNEYTG